MKKLLLKICIAISTVFVMLGTIILIVIFHVAQFFRKLRIRDPFHDSRRHPLNSPGAPRG